MTTLAKLQEYAKSKGLKIYEEKLFSAVDQIAIRIDRVNPDTLEPISVSYAFEYKKHNFIWFESCGDKLFFSHFYNQNTGSAVKGFKRGFNFLYKENLLD